MLDPLNGLCLCPRCHKFLIGLAAHENPIRLLLWLEDARPITLEYLKTKTEEMLNEDKDNPKGQH